MLMKVLLKICHHLFRLHRELVDLKNEKKRLKEKEKKTVNVYIISNVTLGIVHWSGSDRNQIPRGSSGYRLHHIGCR